MHSLKGLVRKKWGRAGAFVQLPLSHLSKTALVSEFLHFLNSFISRECVQLQRAMQLLEGYRSTPAQKKLEGLRLLGAGPAQKAGMKRGICGPFFSDKKNAFKYQNYTTLHL